MPGQFQHILVPVDFTERNRHALEAAFESAQRHFAKVTLLHVVPTLDYADEEIEDYYVRLESAARKNLDAMAQEFGKPGIEVHQAVKIGRPAREIVAFASEHAVDLIVMSAHKPRPEQPEKGLAALSGHVAMLCPCSVMLVKH